MREPKVQPGTSIVFCRRNIFVFLGLRHGVPDFVTLLVPANVVIFDQHGEDGIPSNNAEYDLVSSAVQRCIVRAIQLCTVSKRRGVGLGRGLKGLRKTVLTFDPMILLACTVLMRVRYEKHSGDVKEKIIAYML